MTEELPEDEEDAVRRFDVELLIVHPSLDPDHISRQLGLQAQHFHRAGDPRKTPKGTPLPGNYRDTRWRYNIEVVLKDQWFAEEVSKLVDYLAPHRAVLKNVRATGGRAQIIVQFFDAYYGDEIDRGTLAKLIELDLDLGIECFNGAQS